ncbi:MAG: hypothetical protein KBT34_15060 [Prevotella sp.]|nr:hypothetical protein [Candidatus Prevotella equi]
MSHKNFLKYTKSPEFQALLERYEFYRNSGEAAYFDSDDLIDIAEYYHMLYKLEDTTEVIDYCLELYPNDSAALLFKARMYLFDHGDVEQAKILYDNIDDKDGNIEAAYVYAEILIHEDKIEEADAHLQNFYEEYHLDIMAPDDEDDADDDDELNFPLDVAMLFTDYGCCEQALKWLDKAEPLYEGQDLDILETRARLLSEQELYEEAEVAWNKVLDIDAYNVNAWMQLCEAQFRNSKFNDAVQSADFAIAIDPDMSDALLAKGNSYYAMNMLTEAEECFRELIKITVGHPLVELLLSTVLMTQNKTEEAFEHIQKSIKNIVYLQAENQTEALKIGTAIACKLDQTDKAKEYLSEMQKRGAPEKDIELINGTIALSNNGIDEAMQHFMAAIESDGSDITTITKVSLTLYEFGLFPIAHKLLKSLISAYKEEQYPTLPHDTFALLAATSRHMGSNEEYIHFLEIATTLSPLDASCLLGEFFPPGTEPKDYVNIAKKELNI